MGISPGGVHDQATLVAANCLGEGSRALFVQNILPSGGARLGDIDRSARVIEDRRGDNLTLELGLADLSLDAASVDGNISQVCQQFLGAVLASDESEEFGSVVDECGPAGSIDEGRMGEERSQERNVSLDTSDSELDESTEHLASRNLVGGSVASALDQHGVVVRSDDGSCKPVSTIETHAVSTSRAVDFDFTGIGGESLGRVFRGDTALDGESARGDALLGQA